MLPVFLDRIGVDTGMDIGSEKELLRYLDEKGVFPKEEAVSVIYYPGGVSGVVALVSDGKRNIIVKQALSRLKVAEVWECDPGRIIIEHRAHEAYARIEPESVPAPLFADDANKVIVREGAPDGTPTWKSQLLGGLLDFEVAAKAIDTLRKIHEHTSRDPAVLEAFGDNSIFYDLRISPYIEKTVQVHPRLKQRSLPVIERLMTEKTALNHGDFSPKNILVDERSICILDYEVAHAGHPSFDLAFFFNHFLLKAVKNARWADAYLNMLRFMAGRYFGAIAFTDPERLERETAELLGFMLLARVDGKSPAEYIDRDGEKNRVRTAAFAVLDSRAATLENVCGLLRDAIRA